MDLDYQKFVRHHSGLSRVGRAPHVCVHRSKAFYQDGAGPKLALPKLETGRLGKTVAVVSRSQRVGQGGACSLGPRPSHVAAAELPAAVGCPSDRQHTLGRACCISRSLLSGHSCALGVA